MRTPDKGSTRRATAATEGSRIRYVGRHPSVFAFGRCFHRGKWLSMRGLSTEALGLLGANPQFETPPCPRGTSPAHTAEPEV